MSPQPRGAGHASLRQSIILTAITQVAVVSATFVQYGMIRRWYGLETLGEFSQIVRVRGILEFAVLLQLPMAISREIAMRLVDSEYRNRQTIIRVGLTLGVGLLATSAAFLTALPTWSAVGLFGNPSFERWIVPFCFLLTGYGSCLLVAAVARGLMVFHIVNTLQLLYVVVVPMGLLVTGRSLDMTTIVSAMGVSAGILALGCLFPLIRHNRNSHATEAPAAATVGYGQASLTLLAYGTPRLLAVLGTGLQLLILPWLVSSSGDLQVLVTLNALLGIVSASTLLVAPLSTVMLPHLSRLIALGKLAEAGEQTGRLLTFALLAGGAGSLGALAAMRPVITLWLGPEIASHSSLLIAGALTIPGFLVLEVMRNPLDSVSKFPWNALAYISGAGATVMTYFALHRWGNRSVELATAASLALGIVGAAGVSAFIGRKLYGFRLADDCIGRCAKVWGCGIVVLSTGLFYLAPWGHAALGTLAFLSYMIVLTRHAPAWLFEVLPAWLQPVIIWTRK